LATSRRISSIAAVFCLDQRLVGSIKKHLAGDDGTSRASRS